MLVENFRPGTLARLGLDYATLRARTIPGSCYCSVSGFGQTGPRRREPGYDAVMQAEGGLMSITGAARRPAVPARRRHRRHRLGHVRGAGHHRGALRARAHRPRPAGGHRHARLGGGAADVSGRHLLRDRRARRRGWATVIRRSCRTRPSPPRTATSCWRSATTSSGGGSARWPALEADERFATNRQRVTRYDELRPIVAERLRLADARRLDRAAWRGGRSVRLGPRSAELFADPQLAARDMMTELDHHDDRTPARARRADQALGHAGRRRRRRRPSASTPTTCSGTISD